MYIIKKSYLFLLFVAMSSCSLLELSVDTGVVPLEKKDLNSRISTRSYSQNFTAQVIAASDSILKVSDDKVIMENAIKWKINATSVMTQAAFQSVPEVALIESWIISTQMNNFVRDTFGIYYFSEFDTLAQKTSEELLQRIDRIARNIYRPREYSDREVFVENYAKAHPYQDLEFVHYSVMQEYTAYLGIEDTALVSTVGSGPEVMNDMSERLTAISNQAQVQIEWQKDLFLLNNDTEGLAEEMIARMDSFAIMADELVTFAQESPEMMTALMLQFQSIMQPMMVDFNSGLQRSIDEISQERVLFQKFIDEQRAIAIKEVSTTGDQLISTTLQELTLMLKQLSWLIILLVVVLTTVLFGLPFFLGFQFAKMKYRRIKKTE